MGLNSGARLGPYEILSLLGAGGMGEVYRARDTKLNREVALKVLPETFARDPERMARFEREAQVLASLNHPNIAQIYGLEESGATRALVMELVEGPTLGELIGGRGADEILAIAKQIADAVEAAHEKIIIHRDLKPANIKVKSDGTVKVLDFGLAKAMDVAVAPASGGQGGETPALQNSPTLSLTAQAGFSPAAGGQATRAGMILGTAAYMSPEQAKGLAVDRRTDIWAFGCVFFEMLTGKRAFEGETLSDVLAAVIMKEPDFSALPEATPPAIGKLIRRCLTKDLKHRLQAIGEARIAIEEVQAGGTGVSPVDTQGQDAHATPGAGQRPALQRMLPWLLGATLALVIGIGAGWWARNRKAVSIPNWSGQRLGGPSLAMGPRISPDGHTLAFQAMVDGLTQVAVMDTDSDDWTVLTKDRTRGYVTELNWSPDGSEIYFDREFSVPRGIYRVSRFGGDERQVLRHAMGPEVLPDGSLLVVRVNKNRDYQLFHFWPDSGRLEPLDGFFAALDICPPVRVFRDGKDAVFFGMTLEQGAKDTSSHLYVLDLSSGKARRLAPRLNLHAISPALFPLAVTSDDRSVLVDHPAGDLQRIISIPRNGKGPIRTVLSLTRPPWFMDVDKSGNLYMDQVSRPLEVLHFAVGAGAPELLASSPSASEYANEYDTFQLPDGRVLIGSIVAGRSRLLVARPDGEATPFVQTKEETSFPDCPVGKDEYAFLLGPAGRAVVAIASIADGRIVRRLTAVPGSQVTDLAASPDGKTIYYVASRTVWAIPAAGGQPRRIGPGDSVAAEPNGKDLVVQLNGKEGIRLMRVPVSGGPARPIPVEGPLLVTDVGINPNAVGKDGQVVLSYAAPDSWFYGAGILDPRSGKITRIPVNFTGDLLSPSWQPGGGVLSTAWPLKVTLWRFHPARRDK